MSYFGQWGLSEMSTVRQLGLAPESETSSLGSQSMERRMSDDSCLGWGLKPGKKYRGRKWELVPRQWVIWGKIGSIRRAAPMKPFLHR